MTIRFGVAGCGNFGGELARILNGLEGTRTVAVLGGRDDSAERLSAELGCETAAGIDELAGRDDVDAVIVASPNFLHKEHVLAAARYGKHVFCEKPVALSLADCREMLAACREASVHFMAGHIMHFFSGIRELKTRLAAGAIGRPLVCHVERTGWKDRQAGAGWKHNAALTGGPLFHFIHELDLAQALMGPAESVYAAGSALPAGSGNDADKTDILLLTFGFPGGAVGSMQIGSAFRWGGHSMKINGSEGAVLIDFKRSEIVLKGRDGTETLMINGVPEEDEDRIAGYLASGGKVAFTGPDSRPPLFLRSAMKREMEVFRDAALGRPIAGEWLGLFDGTAALSSVATAEAAMAALKDQAWNAIL